jgi:hypothetical protein
MSLAVGKCTCALFLIEVKGSKSPQTAGVLSNLNLAPDGKQMVVLAPATNADDRQAGNHVTFMLNFFGDVQRRVR